MLIVTALATETGDMQRSEGPIGSCCRLSSNFLHLDQDTSLSPSYPTTLDSHRYPFIHVVGWGQEL